MEINNQSSRRRQQTQKSISAELTDITKSLQQEEERKKKRELWKNEIEKSDSYQAVKTAKTLMDDYYLDPLLGLVPVVGDILP